jgi:subtilase family serine protease
MILIDSMGVSMKNRLRRYLSGKPEKVTDINRFFLACEFKPLTPMWSVIDPFAYDVKPAYLYGKLGVISYNPASYSIVETCEGEPLLGYVLTITNPETILLLDKVKGYNGPDAFNMHIRKLCHVYTAPNKVITAWAYILSKPVMDAYQMIQQVEFGLWQEDDAQIDLLDKITKPD